MFYLVFEVTYMFRFNNSNSYFKQITTVIFTMLNRGICQPIFFSLLQFDCVIVEIYFLICSTPWRASLENGNTHECRTDLLFKERTSVYFFSIKTHIFLTINSFFLIYHHLYLGDIVVCKEKRVYLFFSSCYRYFQAMKIQFPFLENILNSANSSSNTTTLFTYTTAFHCTQ